MANGSHIPAQSGAARIVISVDAMGGDRGPAAVVAGLALSAAQSPDAHYLLHGNESELAPMVAREAALAGRVTIRHAAGGDIVTVERIPHPQSGRGASEVLAVFPVTCPSAAEFAAATAKPKPAPVTFTAYPVAATCPATGAEYGTAE